MHESIINERVWAGTNSNPNRVHAFISGIDRPASCNKRYRAGDLSLQSQVSRGPVTEVTYCASCMDHLLSLVQVREGSMRPSTGGGDYLPSVGGEPTTPVNQHGEPLAFDPTGPETRALLDALYAIRSASSGSLDTVLNAFDVLDDAGLFDGLDRVACHDYTAVPAEQLSGRWSMTPPPLTISRGGLRLVHGAGRSRCDFVLAAYDRGAPYPARCDQSAGHNGPHTG